MPANPYPLNRKYPPQLLVGGVLSGWLYLFLVLVAPFDVAELPLPIRGLLMPGYALVFFLSYALLIPLQNHLYSLRPRWTFGLEALTVGLFCLYALPLVFAYYSTPLVNGDYSFPQFAVRQYLPILAILLPVIFVGRYLAGHLARSEVAQPAPAPATITLRGDYKLDILNLPMADLVAIEGAGNYAAVHYLMEDKLVKKLLRTSLRKLHAAVPGLVQVHRSYLINPRHFVAWEGALTLSLTQITVPVSQKYKPALLALPIFTPKGAGFTPKPRKT